MSDVTLILNALESGDDRAADELLPAVYQELRQLAAHKLANERPGQTLQATALVHEAYLRLVGSDGQRFKSRAYFFGAAAEAMRRILIEHARRKKSPKLGGHQQRVEMEEVILPQKTMTLDDLLTLDEALRKLAQKDKNKAELVKLRYFAGLTGKEAAQILDISMSTADEHWAYARAWLRVEIEKGHRSSSRA
jgi:RNA polymerase sigma factor (TIGR02999 family)